MYFCIRGGAMIKGISCPVESSRRRTVCLTSKRRGRPGMPKAFREGETARQMVLSVRVSSATTRLVHRGSIPLATHSTEA